jgi:hypothetical protein
VLLAQRLGADMRDQKRPAQHGQVIHEYGLLERLLPLVHDDEKSRNMMATVIDADNVLLYR